LILEEETNGNTEDLALVESIYSRTALNIKSEIKFTSTLEKPVKSLTNEINNI